MFSIHILSIFFEETTMVNSVLCLVILSVFISNTVQEDKYVANKYEVENPKCPLGPVVTATFSGELGNNVWDYASILALARLLPGNRQPYIRQYHAHFISHFFKGPLLPIVEKIPLHCSCWNGSDLKKENEGAVMGSYDVSMVEQWNKPGNVIVHSPIVLVKPVMHEIKFIKSRLKYKDNLIQDANQVFSDISSKFVNKVSLDNQSLTFVGVHVRRTDYLQHLSEEKRAGTKFFNFAFDYFRNRKDLGKCVFLVVSDDNEWVKENLISNKTNSDVFLVGIGVRDNPGRDITVLSLCNHTIFDYGSFGLWGAVYAGGEVVTSSGYGQAHPFVFYKNFHFFDAIPDKELFTLSYYHKQE